MKNTKSIKIKATAKIEELKTWIHRHFIGVYIGIGTAICLVMFVLGLVLGQAIFAPAHRSELQSQTVSAEKTISAGTSDFEIVIRSFENGKTN